MKRQGRNVVRIVCELCGGVFTGVAVNRVLENYPGPPILKIMAMLGGSLMGSHLAADAAERFADIISDQVDEI